MAGEQFHTRSLPLGAMSFRAGEDGDGLTIEGYLARFNEPATISDWLGEYTEEFQRGSFSKTLLERGPARVKMQIDHGHDQMLGALPIGVWVELREDKHGVWGSGRLLDSWHTIPVRAAIEAGAIDGMSIRIRVIEETMRMATKPGELDHRTITEVSLLEGGPVVWPAYEGTTVGVRSAALELCRSSFQHPAIVVSAPVAPVGDSADHKAVADPPVGLTRRDMRIAALTALGVNYEFTDRGAA